jgi:hypothetical protein
VPKINQATFKRETIVIGAKDKIAIRKLLQDAGISCPPKQDIFSYTNDYLGRLKTLATRVSGDAPRPEPVNTQFIKDIENKDGNERLLEILQQKDILLAKFTEWTAKEKLIIHREPVWNLLVQLENRTTGADDLDDLKAQIAAIRENRLLLQEPDPVQPILDSLTEKVGHALNAKKAQFNTLYNDKWDELQANQYFLKLTPEQKHEILVKHQILAKPEIKPMDATSLLNQLQKASLYVWDTKIAALSGQFQSALDDAIVLAAPKATSFCLPKRTISNQADIDTYITELKSELEELLQNSSSIILK